MSLYLIISIFLASYLEPASGTLILQFQNLESTEGQIRVAVYNSSETFLNEDKILVAKEIKVIQAGENELIIDDLPFGKYAIAVYHDINGDRALDTNLFGVPKEPYCFSNKGMSKWKKPSFEDAAFNFSTDGQVIKLALKRWRDL